MARCPSAAWFPYCPSVARFPYCPAAARLRYCLSEGRLVSLSSPEGHSVCALSFRSSVSLLTPRRSLCLLFRHRSVSPLSPRRPLGFLIIPRWPLRLRIVLSPLGVLIVPPPLALLILPPPLGFAIVPTNTAWSPYYPPKAAPFAHCPSAARPDFFSFPGTSNFASGHHTILASSFSQARRNARSD